MSISVIQIQGTNHDVYGTVAEADAYAAASFGNSASWTAAAFTDKQKILVTATRLLERQRWVGTITDLATPQPLVWPRTGVTNPFTGEAVDPSTVPPQIFDGFFELALALAADTDGTILSQASTGTNVRREHSRDKVGDVETERETERFRPTNLPGASPRFPQAVTELIGPFLQGTSADLLSGVASGTDATSPLTDEDRFKLDLPGFP